MPNILAHVHLGVVDHLVILAYIEGTERYWGRCFTVYHPMRVEWFPELDELVRNHLRTCSWLLKRMVTKSLKRILTTYMKRLVTTLMTKRNRFVIVMVIVHFCRHGEKKCLW
jgi:hypothetical protein